MSRDWEQDFSIWSRGPGATEQEKVENTERQIRDAVSASEKLRNRNIKVFAQGSYRNRVNVRRDSDVDIGVLCFDTFFPEYPDDNVKSQLSEILLPASYQYSEFKNELEEALVAKFGRTAVTRGAKAFDIKANSYRIEADVVAFFEHRRYTSITEYHSGVEMRPDNATPPRIRNWPEQHYTNGVGRNDVTTRRFKRVTRILKNLSNEMASKGIQSAKDTPSYLVECLVFNADDSCFNYTSYEPMIRAVLANLFNRTIDEKDCSEWGEVNELKYLFRLSQPWSRQGTHKFLSDAWNYIGYE